MVFCSIEGCGKKHCARGLCKMHYGRVLYKSSIGTEKTCPNCGNKFLVTRTSHQICCSRKCGQLWSSRVKGKPYHKKYYADRREKLKDYARTHTAKLKAACYAAYGGNVCRCCGEKEKKFLTLDHINNDGYLHRRKSEKGNGIGNGLYRWIVKNNFPPIFQILCFNCNCGKNVNGGICPHKDDPTNGLHA